MLSNPCSVSAGPLNTGLDCQVKMFAPALIIMVPAKAKWTAEDEADFSQYINEKAHEVPSKRWFPLFGNQAPIKTITDGKESDVTVTYDDGSISFIRNGTITRTFNTNKGGLALAKAFMSFNKFGNWAFIEVDKFNNVLRKQNADGTFSGVPVNVAYAPTPENATFKTEFLPAFTINYRVEDYIQKGVISVNSDSLLDLTGLVNAEIFQAAAATTTKLKIGVRTVGAQVDLVSEFSEALAHLSNFVIVKAGVVITATSIAVSNGFLEITIPTATTGDVYVVSGAAASAWLGNSIAGFEAVKSVSITIP